MKISLLSLVIILFLKCNNDNSNDFSLKIHSTNKKIKIDDTINISVNNKNKIDSIQFLLNKIEINSNHILNNTNTWPTKNSFYYSFFCMNIDAF